MSHKDSLECVERSLLPYATAGGAGSPRHEDQGSQSQAEELRGPGQAAGGREEKDFRGNLYTLFKDEGRYHTHRFHTRIIDP